MKALLEKKWGLRSLAYYSTEADVCCLNVFEEYTSGTTYSNSPCSQVLHLDSEGRLRSLEVLGISTASEKVVPIAAAAKQEIGDIVFKVTDSFESLQPDVHFSAEESRLTLLYSETPPSRCIHLGDSFVVGVDDDGEVLRLDVLNVLSADRYKMIRRALDV